MPYILNTPDDQRAMCAAIGIESIDQLLDAIPRQLRLDRPLAVPPAMGEMELSRHMRGLAARNLPAGEATCFLGAGSYDHFIPAVVDAIASRSEFYSSYTPYQPEVSQGNLHVQFRR
jgi:glycine dehydrogenase subunit 1